MIRAAIFDKDGTLFHFAQSWGAWTRSALAHLTKDEHQARQLSQKLGFDPVSGIFEPTSIIIAHTTEEIAHFVAEQLGRSDGAALAGELADLAKSAPMVPAVDLPATFRDLRRAGLKIGLATNDSEAPARHHLQTAGILPLFDFVAGCDSGWGGKPAPGQLLAFAKDCGLPAADIAMVGDSVHDMAAARQAGMIAVAVLTGIATKQDLLPHSDVVLDDISALLPWITAQNARQR